MLSQTASVTLIGHSAAAVVQFGPNDGFNPDNNMEDYLAASISPTSGATPLDRQQGAPTPVLDQYTGYKRPQAHTEDSNGSALSQWRSNVPSLPSGP